MRLHRSMSLAALTVALAAGAACGKKESAAPPPTAKPAPTPDAAAAAPTPKDPPPPPVADGEEVDPSASGTAVPRALTDADLEGLEAPGKREHTIGWTDRYGTNAVVISREAQRGGALLTATHARREGDGSWTTVRTFKELISDCEFDVSLYAQVGDWSVTDLDDDGLGEATFAWSSGCRSDVSPLTHKVLVVEDGEKYVLRGMTIDQTGAGGTFEADPAFKKVPAAFRAHAERVWKATVKEPR